jgi:4-hydroxyphenylpyruvate dioxygenase
VLKKEFMRYKHSIASVSLSGTLREKMLAIAKAGYDGIELFENDLTVSDIRPAELRQMASDLGIEIIALQPLRDFEAMPNALHRKNLDRAERKFDLMTLLGTKTLSVCSNTSPLALDDMDKAAADLHELAERAAFRGFKIGYEALSWGRYVYDYRQSIEIVNRANHPNLGYILDNLHINSRELPMDDIYKLSGAKITLVQVADAQKMDVAHIVLGRHYRCFPGQGSFPVVAFMKAVDSTGYNGYISHEIFSDDFRASRVYPVALDGKRSLIWLTNEISKKNIEKPILKKIQFIEFATDKFSQFPLIALLKNVGFVKTHQHKSKDVSLYQLGDATLILNKELDAHATDWVDKHGNMVCAVGFSAQNPQYLESWARQLHYKWIKASDNEDTLNISAVKGSSNLLYYFIDEKDLKSNYYELEFDLINPFKINNGVQQFDHIGHVVSDVLTQSNTLFYRAMLGLEIEETLELLDPRGLMYSRVARNETKSIRIPLSSTRSRGTSSDRFIESLAGAGIQQIALSTTDIFKTAAWIPNKNMILSVPDNYYNDLISKSVLPLEEVERMRALNILYDVQGEGSFYHFYFKEQNGLFIEIIQRVGGYDRYGEPNAQVRLAAQARDRNT